MSETILTEDADFTLDAPIKVWDKFEMAARPLFKEIIGMKLEEAEEVLHAGLKKTLDGQGVLEDFNFEALVTENENGVYVTILVGKN